VSAINFNPLRPTIYSILLQLIGKAFKKNPVKIITSIVKRKTLLDRATKWQGCLKGYTDRSKGGEEFFIFPLPLQK